jgi:hypothetical protein
VPVLEQFLVKRFHGAFDLVERVNLVVFII